MAGLVAVDKTILMQEAGNKIEREGLKSQNRNQSGLKAEYSKRGSSGKRQNGLMRHSGKSVLSSGLPEVYQRGKAFEVQLLTTFLCSDSLCL